MKKTKLKLDALKVQSFVTSMDEKQKQTVDGGVWHWIISFIEGYAPRQAGGASDCASNCPAACPPNSYYKNEQGEWE